MYYDLTEDLETGIMTLSDGKISHEIPGIEDIDCYFVYEDGQVACFEAKLTPEQIKEFNEKENK